MKRAFESSSQSAEYYNQSQKRTNYNHPSSSSSNMGPNRGGGTYARQQARTSNQKPRAPANLASVDPPVHDRALIESSWQAMGARGPPNVKWVENPKGVLANYLTALGESAKYQSKRVQIGGSFQGYRATIVADPNPPPPTSAYGQGSLPPMAQPIIGTGDAATAKDAEKLAALHACLQLGARGLFTASNLPTRTRGLVTPLHVASTSNQQGNNNNNSGGGGAPQYASYPSQTLTAPPDGNDGKKVVLSKGQVIGLEEARGFMDYYCQRFNFGRPDLDYTVLQAQGRGRHATGTWRATLLVNGRRIGMGEAKNKKEATNRAYLDTAQYLESCDADLWGQWSLKKQQNQIQKGTIAAHVMFQVDPKTDEELRETVWESKESHLYKRAKAMLDRDRRKFEDEKERQRLRRIAGAEGQDALAKGPANSGPSRRQELRAPMIEAKSKELLTRLQDYQVNPKLEAMRAQRLALPVQSNASSVLAKIATSSVVVVLAATGSGKTTQIPQLILDDWIMRGDGGKCNIVCTQPRRIAAISVAERVAKERGEAIGDSVGYQVRFESKAPKPDGSVLFCTTGLFLRRLQSDLNNSGGSDSFLDTVTHVCVDEVHERDVDTDLLLFVLRRLMHERRRAGKAEIRVILMSATIDPVLFTNYFADPDSGRLAPVVEVPGRSFPVDKFWLDDTVQELQALRLPPNQGGWVWSEKSVGAYLQRELVPHMPIDPRTGKPVGEIDDLDMPYPLIALIIASVLTKSEEGHVLVFLPGWDEIQAVRNILIDSRQFPLFGVNFNQAPYEIHLLHSSVPIAEQNAVFEPPAPGIRRIVLSTNIAETSVTIPDVVYVVDSAKCKEKRYDPERRLSQLVSAWTGTSNVLQRAGRAGRHRAGEYYGIVSKARFEAMDIHQTVEMLRTDLANTCMHITGLQLPGLTVEDVLASTIQPPERARVYAAMTSLLMVGAIDREEKLTSLGRVLLQLPVDAAIGKLCLLGSFFRCLEQTLTLAAILTNRDPFMSPPLLKAEADRVKNTWAPADFRSDPLAILSAYNVWWSMQSRNDYVQANNFARENFLSKPTLLQISKIKDHILQSLDKAGVLNISAGGSGGAGMGRNFRRAGTALIPPELNVNGESLPLLSALVAAAVAPNFAIRTSEKSLRTSQDKTCAIHPSSVNSRKNEKAADLPVTASKQLYAFAEKSKTGGIGGKQEGQMFLRGTTLLDPLGYMLFGAHQLRVTDSGLECDGWLPVVGNVQALDDVERLKEVLDFSLLRVFEGLGVAIGQRHQRQQIRPGRTQPARIDDSNAEEREEAEQEAVDMSDPTLSAEEVADLDKLTSSVVKVLNFYADSRGSTASRGPSRPETPGYPGANGGGGGGAYRPGGPSGMQMHSAAPGGPIMRPFAASVPVTRSGTPHGYGQDSRPGSSQGPPVGGGSRFGGGGGGNWRNRG